MQTTNTLPHSADEAMSGIRVEHNQAAIALLRSWIEEGDAEEQRETGEFLIRALAEDPIRIGQAGDGNPS